MEIYERRIYEVALKDNYIDRCDYASFDEAMKFIIKTGKPENYILTRREHTRVFDDAGVFYSDKVETHRIGFTIYEVWKSDEIGHEFHEKRFYDIQEVHDYMNLMDRYEPGWHFFCREFKY